MIRIASRFDIKWEHINIESHLLEARNHYPLKKLTQLFKSSYPKLQELAYLHFLLESPWGLDFNFKRGVERIRIDLQLPLYEGEGLSYKIRNLRTAKIWATEDALDYDKVEMVRAALDYMITHDKPIPPVSVWLSHTSGSLYNLLTHDGHHRIYVAHEKGIKIPAVVLEYWLDDREDSLISKKLHFRHFNQYVKDMPVEKYELHPLT